jgi:hypothetical protein
MSSIANKLGSSFLFISSDLYPESRGEYAVRCIFSFIKWNIVHIIVKAVIVFYLVYVPIKSSYNGQKECGKLAPNPGLYGIYDVTMFAINKGTITPTIYDSIYWKRFVVDKYSTSITKANDKNSYLKIELDTIEKTVRLSSWRDITNVYNLKYTLQDSILNFRGVHLKDTLNIQLKKRKLNSFLLESRGFNWLMSIPIIRSF